MPPSPHGMRIWCRPIRQCLQTEWKDVSQTSPRAFLKPKIHLFDLYVETQNTSTKQLQNVFKHQQTAVDRVLFFLPTLMKTKKHFNNNHNHNHNNDHDLLLPSPPQNSSCGHKTTTTTTTSTRVLCALSTATWHEVDWQAKKEKGCTKMFFLLVNSYPFPFGVIYNNSLQMISPSFSLQSLALEGQNTRISNSTQLF